MSSSTSRHASFSVGLLALLFTGIVGAPVLWLGALQAGYAMAYQACDTRSNSWVVVPTLATLVVVAIIAIVVWRADRRARRDRLPMPLLGWMSVGIGTLMVLVMIASSIAPLVLHPCD